MLRLLVIWLSLLFNWRIAAIWKLWHIWTVSLSIRTLSVLILNPNLLLGHLRLLLLKLSVLMQIVHLEILISPQSFSWPTIVILLLMDILVSYWLLVLNLIWLILNLNWLLFNFVDLVLLLLLIQFWWLCLVIIRALIRAREVGVVRPYIFMSALFIILGKYFSHWDWHFFLLGNCLFWYPKSLSFHGFMMIFTCTLNAV